MRHPPANPGRKLAWITGRIHHPFLSPVLAPPPRASNSIVSGSDLLSRRLLGLVSLVQRNEEKERERERERIKLIITIEPSFTLYPLEFLSKDSRRRIMNFKFRSR